MNRHLTTQPLSHALLWLSLSLAACNSNSEEASNPNTPGDLEIIGEYVTEFGTGWTFSEESWQQIFPPFVSDDPSDGGVGLNPDAGPPPAFDTATYAIAEFSNEDNFVIGLSDESDAFNPNLFQKVIWTFSAGVLHVCTAVFDAETVEEAREATADPTDLETGCGSLGFPWCRLTPGTLE